MGEFKNGLLNGFAIKYDANGSITQEGIFKDDEFLHAKTSENKELPSQMSSLPPCPSDPNATFDNCFGTWQWDDGSKYEGEWKKDMKHGRGTFTFANGDKYVGEYKDDLSHAQGTYTYANGDEYVGEYRNGKKHGQGTFTYKIGDKYIGEYKKNLMHGQGMYIWANGDKYQGAWKDSKRPVSYTHLTLPTSVPV